MFRTINQIRGRHVALASQTPFAYILAMDTTLPADAETQRLAQEISKASGKPVKVVLREALYSHAWSTGVVPPPPRERKTPEEIRAAIDAIVTEVRALPILDARPDDEILGYDENGLPA